MAIIRKKLYRDFVSISNELAQNESISYEAKGLLLELLSRPENWKVYKEQLIRDHSGRSKINRIFKELQNAGYLEIESIRSSGRITDRIWNVYDMPSGKMSCNSIQNLNDGNTYIKKSLNKENQHLQKHNNIKNTDNNKKTDNKNIREKDKKGKSESVPQIKYAEYVEMTEQEYDKLVEQLGSKRRVKSAIAILDNYKGSSGKKYKSDYRAILSWVIDKLEEREHKKVGDGLNYMTLEELDEYERANPEDEIRQKIHEERRRRIFFKGEKI